MASAAAASGGVRTRRNAWGRLLRNPAGVVGGLLVLLVVLSALLAPFLTPYDTVTLNAPDRLQGPSARHWAGTDQYGRDTLTRMLFGARTSLLVSGAAIAFAGIVGTVLGTLAGYYRGATDAAIMRFTDILLSFPAILLAIALLAFLGSGLVNLVLAIGAVYTGPFVRVARAATLSVREEAYVEAGRAVGARDARVLALSVLPNIAAPLLVEVTLRLAYAILAEASLSFLGLGAQPPTPSWGQMIAEGRRFLSLSPWGSLMPGVAILVTVLGFNLLGDGLRDALDPRLRSR